MRMWAEMLRIRLKRTGARNQPSYRIVVADSRKPRDGAFVEQLGHYDPLQDPPKVVLDYQRALEWVSHGAQPSEAVKRMLENRNESDDAERE